MSWIEQNAIKRIFNAFKRNKKQIYTQDVEALELIIASLDDYKKAYVNDNLLYAKLLCVMLRQNVSFYGDIKTALKKISDDLKQPLDYHLQFLTIELNNVQLTSYLESIGIKPSHLSTIATDKLKENEKEIVEAIKKSWDVTTVEKSFFNSANTFLKDINNYK